MHSYVSFRCSGCNARLKASVRLVGQARPCPACRERIVLQPVPPPMADPMLVFEDVPLPPEEFRGWSLRA
jgi:DNA-directed RNA polymerase subunit RPC12/RpoP